MYYRSVFLYAVLCSRCRLPQSRQSCEWSYKGEGRQVGRILEQNTARCTLPIYLNTSYHKERQLLQNLQRTVSCDVEHHMKSPPACTALRTRGENIEGPPAGSKTMKGSPAGTEAFPTSNLLSVRTRDFAGDRVRAAADASARRQRKNNCQRRFTMPKAAYPGPVKCSIVAGRIE